MNALAALGTLVAAGFAPPGPALAEDLATGRFAELLAALAEAHGMPTPALPVPPFSQLETAYVGLFVNHPEGVPVPPYVGYAQDGRLFGPSFDRLLDFLEAHGVVPRPEFSDLPDHVAAVGEALALLAERDPPAARRLAREFLLPWFARYRGPLEDADPTGFYAALAGFVHDVLSREVNGEAQT